jgi:hypothetical protein
MAINNNSIIVMSQRNCDGRASITMVGEWVMVMGLRDVVGGTTLTTLPKSEEGRQPDIE